MATGQVNLVVPGLFHLPMHELDPAFLRGKLPSLNSLLRFGRRLPNTLFDFDSIIAHCLGLDPSQKLPFASAFVDSNADSQGEYLLCKPIHLKPDMRNAFALPLEEGQEINNDITILIKDLSDEFKQDCDIENLADGHWLMRLKQCLPPRHFPPYLSIVGRKVDQYIEQSRESLPWYQLINEMQMFMHAHALNQKRLLEGKLPINSLWCWGAGEYRHPQQALEYCFCDDPVLARYIDRAGITLHPLSAILDADRPGDGICIDLRLLQALKTPAASDLQSLLAELEEIVLAPLLRRVLAGKIQLRLRSAHEVDILLSRYSRLKIWRKPVGLDSLASAGQL